MKVIAVVTGGRDFNDRVAVFNALGLLNAACEIVSVAHGACPVGTGGADWLADDWAREMRKPCVPYPPDPRNGAQRFAARNKRMINSMTRESVEMDARALLVAFPGGRGTAMTERIAREAGIRIWHPTTQQGANGLREAFESPAPEWKVDE
jgi:hypothetical protein